MVILMLIILFVIILLSCRTIENYGSPSGASLLQLYARDPQDSYQIIDYDYMLPYHVPYWPYFQFF